MFERINKELIAAMKSGEKVRLMVLRMIKAKILHVNARGDLPEKDIIKIIQNHAKSLQETIDICRQHEKNEEMLIAQKELDIVSEYLPKMLSDEETKNLVRDAITTLGVSSQKEIGKVMKEVLGSRSDVDGAVVRRLVLELLP